MSCFTVPFIGSSLVFIFDINGSHRYLLLNTVMRLTLELRGNTTGKWYPNQKNWFFLWKAKNHQLVSSSHTLEKITYLASATKPICTRRVLYIMSTEQFSALKFIFMKRCSSLVNTLSTTLILLTPSTDSEVKKKKKKKGRDYDEHSWYNNFGLLHTFGIIIITVLDFWGDFHYV
jgi:hypothetical protein